MKHRALTKDGDWLYGKGQSSFSRDIDAVVLNVITRCRSWKGECFFAPAEGVDYNNFLKRGTKELLDMNVKRVILQSEGVLRLVAYESSLEKDDRKLTIKAVIQTIYGQANVEI